jgi:chromosome transmission fidelity protein 4
MWELTGRPDAPGATYLAYTPNGKKLVTAGVDNYCRVFSTGSDDEPITVDNCQEDNTAVVAGVGTHVLEKSASEH